MKLSPEQIQRLTEVGFKRPHQGSFDDRFNELVAYKRANGHCDVHTTGKDVSLGGGWCCGIRSSSYKQIQNNGKPKMKRSPEQIQRLTDLDFKWTRFDMRIHDLVVFKRANGHCDVPTTSRYASLGRWCYDIRVSHEQIQNNQKPKMKLSAEQIQRLTDLDFKWAAAVTRSWENIRTDTLVALPNEITSQGTLPSEFALSSSPRLGGNMMSNTGSI